MSFKLLLLPAVLFAVITGGLFAKLSDRYVYRVTPGGVSQSCSHSGSFTAQDCQSLDAIIESPSKVYGWPFKTRNAVDNPAISQKTVPPVTIDFYLLGLNFGPGIYADWVVWSAGVFGISVLGLALTKYLMSRG